jgi:hypothetical protein
VFLILYFIAALAFVFRIEQLAYMMVFIFKGGTLIDIFLLPGALVTAVLGTVDFWINRPRSILTTIVTLLGWLVIVILFASYSGLIHSTGTF